MLSGWAGSGKDTVAKYREARMLIFILCAMHLK
jgi:hypothetical protein